MNDENDDIIEELQEADEDSGPDNFFIDILTGHKERASSKKLLMQKVLRQLIESYGFDRNDLEVNYNPRIKGEEFFLDFISRSIEGRIVNDIGGRGITLPDDVDVIDNAQRQLHDFVAGCVRSALSDRLDDLNRLSDQDLRRTVDDIYEAAFAVLAAVAERAA